MEKIRKHFYFSGRVQGVGFRYRSYYIAQSMGLTGWVRNLWDDRVEMEVQGTREEIREMVERLSQQSFVEIEGIEAREIPLEEEFGFHVKDSEMAGSFQLQCQIQQNSVPEFPGIETTFFINVV